MLPTAPAIEPQGPTHTFVAPWNAENVRFAPQEFFQGVGSMLGMDQPSAPQGPQVQAPKAPTQGITPFGHGMDVDPEAMKAVKKAGLSDDNSLKRISDAVSQGFLPGTPEFRQAVGVSAKQLGMQPSGAWGGLAGWADRWSLDRQNAIQKQQAADLVGSHFLNAAIQYQTKLQDPSLPKTVEEADALLGRGAIPRLPSQADYQGPVAPGGNALPSPALHPAQQMMAANAIHGIGTGGLMQTAEGIVPTQYASMQGRQITPDQALELQGLSGVVPPGEQPYQTSMPVPATAFNAALAQKGNTQRQNIRPVDLSQNFEGLLFATMAKPEFAGKYRSTTEFAAANPELTQQLRKQADVTEKRDLYAYQQDQQAARQIDVNEVNKRKNEQIDSEIKLSGGVSMLDQINKLGEKGMFLPASAGEAARAKQAFSMRAKIASGLDPDVSQYQQIKDGLRAQLVRIGGDTGAFSNQEQERALKLIPDEVGGLSATYPFYKLPDTKEVRDRKITLLGEFLQAGVLAANGPDEKSRVQKRLREVLAKIPKGPGQGDDQLSGFKTKKDLVQSMIDQGLSKDEIFATLKKKGL